MWVIFTLLDFLATGKRECNERALSTTININEILEPKCLRAQSIKLQGFIIECLAF